MNGYASDVGFITLPNGRRIAIALFARYGSNRPYTIARAARIIYNGFLYASPQQLTSNNWNYQPNRNAAPVSLAQPASQ